MTNVWAVLGGIITIIIGIFGFVKVRSDNKHKIADKARKDLENANENDDPSSFLDGFGGVR